MAIINSYPTVTPTGSDLIIGTDVSTTPHSTKTFTIDSINTLAPQGTVTSVALTAPSAFSVTGSPITSSGTIAITGAGSASQVILGNGTLGSLPGGPYLPLAGGTMSGDIVLPDSVLLKVGSGTSGDLRIYHDGNNSYIDDQGTGDLFIKGSTKVFISTSSGGQMAQFDDSGSARLYFNGGLKFSTAAAGASVNGSLTVQGSAGNNGLVTLAGNGAVNGVTNLKLAVGSVNKVTVTSTGAIFTDQVTIPTTPVAATDAASKAYVDSQVGYSTYVARVTQSGTNAPVATVISNNTGLTFTWSRNNTGSYRVSPSSAFVVNKTWIQMTGGDLSVGTTSVSIKDIGTAFATAVNINLINGNVADEITAAFVEIRIYP